MYAFSASFSFCYGNYLFLHHLFPHVFFSLRLFPHLSSTPLTPFPSLSHVHLFPLSLPSFALLLFLDFSSSLLSSTSHIVVFIIFLFLPSLLYTHSSIPLPLSLLSPLPCLPIPSSYSRLFTLPPSPHASVLPQFPLFTLFPYCHLILRPSFASFSLLRPLLSFLLFFPHF